MRVFARQMTKHAKAVAAGVAVAAFWLAVWILVAALVAQPLILPGPGAVALALSRLVCDGGTWAILAGSGARILGGLALAAACGGMLAGVSVRSRLVARLVAPVLSFIKATPVACVVVLLLIWLGSARVSIAAVFLMALPGVYFSLVEGLTQVNKPLEQMFRLHGVRGWRLFCAHTWREVLPFVLSCARAVIGMSWKAGVAAELIGMAVGTVGERIYQAKLLIETADLLAWTVLVVAASWVCERALVWLLQASSPAAWRAAVRAHGHGARRRAGGAGGEGGAEYDEWGNLLNEENPHQLQQLIRLPGQQYDEESGLYYNRHRYYDPLQGRYITQDPIGLKGGWNFYQYPLNPVQYIDSMGLASKYGHLNNGGYGARPNKPPTPDPSKLPDIAKQLRLPYPIDQASSAPNVFKTFFRALSPYDYTLYCRKWVKPNLTCTPQDDSQYPGMDTKTASDYLPQTNWPTTQLPPGYTCAEPYLFPDINKPDGPATAGIDDLGEILAKMKQRTSRGIRK